MNNDKKYKAYLRVRKLADREIIDSVGVSCLSEHHVERVMRGMLMNMNTDEYFIDDSEVDEARSRENP